MPKTTKCYKCGKNCLENGLIPHKSLCHSCKNLPLQKNVTEIKCPNCGLGKLKDGKCDNCKGEIQENWREYTNKKLENYCKKCKDYVPFHIMPHGNRICSICNPDLKTHLPAEVLQKTVTEKPVKPPITFRHSMNWTTCINCGERFQAKRGDAKTCSTKCRVAANRRLNHETPTQKAATDMKLRIKSLITILLPPDLADELNKKIDEKIKN